jgi:hypothetical protein
METIWQMIENHSDRFTVELRRKNQELNLCHDELREYQELAIRYGCLTPKALEKTWRGYEEKTSRQLQFANMSKEKQKVLADKLAREYASRIFSPEHNVFSDSWQYYRVGFGEGFIKALELVGKGDGE